MEVTQRREVTVGSDTYTHNVTQTLNIQEHEDAFSATVEEESYIGSYYSETRETFIDGVVYSEISNVGSYQAPMEVEEFQARYVPVVLLDSSLYSVEAKTEKTMTFTKPLAVESWLGEDAMLIEAGGTAELDEELGISRATYDATYVLGGVRFKDSFVVNISNGPEEMIKAPEGKYEELDNIYGPRLLNETIGWLRQMKSYTTSYTDAARCEGSLTWLETGTYHGYAAEDGYLLDGDKTILLMDWTGQQGEQASFSESYENGVFHVVYPDGSEEDQDADDVTAQNIGRTLIGRSILADTDIETYELVVLGDSVILKCTMTEKNSEYLGEVTADILFEEGAAVLESASEYSTLASNYLVGFDRITGLPTAVELEYKGRYVIDGEEVILARNMTQSMTYGHPSTYEAITGEVLELKTDAPDPTPLLYKVTGASGETMYLFGTIHVGDSRTANLPQYLLDAFEESDALAVEFDSDAFETQLENDSDLLEQYMKAMLYTDGTIAKDHIADEELYEMAEDLLRAIGQYEDTTILYKPYVWSQTIDNYNLSWSYDITSDYGLESRLQELAREQGKEIRDVESGIEQLTMLTSFSDQLQEMLLEESVYTSRVAYINDVRELFELWCSGDEAALIEYINEDPDVDESEMTEEEKLEYQEFLELYAEYEKAISTDRNAGMLDVAEEYLRSGDTVFYAVGLAHLLAEDGLVNTLREAGYTVEIVR